MRGCGEINLVGNSMCRKVNCLDNNVVEGFFGTLKQEHVYFCDYAPRDETSSNESRIGTIANACARLLAI